MHAGSKLTPPLGGEERMEAFPALQPTEVIVAGDTWKGSSTDVAIAGGGARGHAAQRMGGRSLVIGDSCTTPSHLPTHCR